MQSVGEMNDRSRNSMYVTWPQASQIVDTFLSTDLNSRPFLIVYNKALISTAEIVYFLICTIKTVAFIFLN